MQMIKEILFISVYISRGVDMYKNVRWSFCHNQKVAAQTECRPYIRTVSGQGHTSLHPLFYSFQWLHVLYVAVNFVLYSELWLFVLGSLGCSKVADLEKHYLHGRVLFLDLNLEKQRTSWISFDFSHHGMETSHHQIISYKCLQD